MSEGLRIFTGEEESAEEFLTEEGIKNAMDRYAKGGEFQRKLSDENGIHVFEVIVAGEKPGEWTEYTYYRKRKYRKFTPGQQMPMTNITVTYYKNNMPENGTILEEYDEATGQWTEIRPQ